MKHCDKMAVTVNPTNQCNMRCTYCMASSGQEQTSPIFMPMEFARRGIADALDGHPTRIKAQSLRFFSPGEPTQAMDVIRECVNYARSIRPGLPTELQTAGVFESEEDAEWIAENFSAVWFSTDGPREINAQYRPDKSGNNRTGDLEHFLEIVQRKTFAGIRATIVPETVHHQDALVEYFHSLGVTYQCFNPVIFPVRRGDGENGATVTQIAVMDWAEGFLRAYQRARELGVCLSSSLTFNFDEPTSVACRSCLPMPQLNPDGSVSSCDMALYLDAPQRLQPFVYGRWNRDIGLIQYDAVKIRRLQARRLESLPICQACSIREFCAGGCAGRVAYEAGTPFAVIPEYCRATRFLAAQMVVGKRVLQYTHP